MAEENSQDTGLEIVPVKKATTELGAGQLQRVMEGETKRRALLTNYIAHHMKDGTDFGKIHIAKNCPNKYNCTNAYHFSKPSLFKPGGEKFASLFKLRATWKRDSDTWEMAGSPKGLFCYTCELMATNGNVVGEGKGAASTDEKGNPNTAIKIAKKRAFIDAILSTGALSDFFTQDLEDMPQESREPMKPYQVPRRLPPQDDEADGAVIQMAPEPEKPTRGYEYPKMDETNDAHSVAAPKDVPPEVAKNAQIIKEILLQLGKNPKDAREAIFDVKLLTSSPKKFGGVKWEPGKNDNEVIDELRKLIKKSLKSKQAMQENDERLAEFDGEGPGKGENGDYSGMS